MLLFELASWRPWTVTDLDRLPELRRVSGVMVEDSVAFFFHVSLVLIFDVFIEVGGMEIRVVYVDLLGLAVTSASGGGTLRPFGSLAQSRGVSVWLSRRVSSLGTLGGRGNRSGMSFAGSASLVGTHNGLGVAR